MYFVDSGFLIALLLKRDQNHAAALEWSEFVESYKIPLLTTQFCLVEVVSFLSGHGSSSEAVEAVRDLELDSQMTIEPCSSTLFDRGMEFLGRHNDKRWGLTDCISFIVMNDHHVDRALAFDNDFVQAGLRALPLE